MVIKDSQDNDLLRAKLLSDDNFFVIDRGKGVKQKVAEIEFINLVRTNSFDNTFTKIYLYDQKREMKEFNRNIEYRLRV